MKANPVLRRTLAGALALGLALAGTHAHAAEEGKLYMLVAIDRTWSR